MYQVYCNDLLIFDPRVKELWLEAPSLTLELNKTGNFSFTIYTEHPYYNQIKQLKSLITVKKDGAVLFRGRPLSSNDGFYNQRQITCEGELAFLLDSRVRPFQMGGGPSDLFAYLVEQHNEQVEEVKQFKAGNVTVTDPNDYINRSNITYETTWDIITTRLINTLGGYLQVRHETDGIYLDYLADFDLTSSQHIDFGENLLDYSRNVSGDEIVTALIPLGAKLKDDDEQLTEERLTITDVNNGKDYVYDQDAVDEYGWIFGTQTWDDVTEAGNLLSKAQERLNELTGFAAEIKLSAVDLSMMDKTIDDFRIGQYVFVSSKPHGLDNTKYLVNQMAINLADPAQNTLSFGRVYKTLTEEIHDRDQTVDGLITTVERVEGNYVTNETVSSAIEDIYSRIDQTSDEILSEVGSTFVTSDGLEEILNTRFSQTEDGFEMQFNELKSWAEKVNGENQVAFEELRKYIRFVEGNIILGDQNSDLQCIITNEKISFEQNGAEVAYISNNKLYITNAEVLDRFTVGNPTSGYFDWIPRANGNLGMKWRAGYGESFKRIFQRQRH